MHVLVMASQKGGSGKTTLSGHLAVEADQAGIGPVALIDTDPQGSLSHWWNSRASGTPHFAKVGLLDLGAALEQLKAAGIKLAVIDTPPAITSSISEVVGHADLVVVPTRPSPHDLRAVGATVDIAERHKKPLIFVVNGATPRARITGEAAIALSQHGTVAPVTLHHRVDFAASMVDGRTVGEAAAKSASAKEVRDLWLYIQDKLSRITGDTTMLPEFKPQHFLTGALSGLADDRIAPPPDEYDIEPIAAAPLTTQHVMADRPAPPVPTQRPVAAAAAPHIVAERRAPVVEDLPPVVVTPPAERRFTMERRTSFTPFAGAERRSSHVFGRRASDRPQ
jgi:chromosome partitioning protein